MLINKYILKKLILSSFFCSLAILAIFFIFALIANLGEDFSFIKIMAISFLNAIQIILYIPLFIFFLIIITFSMNVRSFNEIIILMHYLNLKKIISIFSILIAVFILIEFNKNHLIQKVEQIMTNITNTQVTAKSNLIINSDGRNKTYLIFKNDLDNQSLKKIILFNINNNEFQDAIYTTNIDLSKNKIITNNYIKLKDNKINEFKENRILIDEINDFNLENRVVHINKKKNFLELTTLDSILNTLLHLLLSILLVVCSFNSKQIIKGNKFYITYSFYAILIFYVYTVSSIQLSEFNINFQFLSLILLLIFNLKQFLNAKNN